MTSDFLQLDGARILVTGASSGIGRATAVELSRRGARIALVGRDQHRLDATASELDGTGHLTLTADLTDADRVDGLLDHAVAELGPLGGLVHAAGIHAARPLKSTGAPLVRDILETNVTTALTLARSFRRRGVHTESSSIVLMSSSSALVGEPSLSAYAASKGAIVALSRSLAVELAREGIRVNCLAPGIVRTPLTDRLRGQVGDAAFAAIEAAHPLGIGDPDDVARAAAFLLSSASRWITGSTLAIDGGYSAR